MEADLMVPKTMAEMMAAMPGKVPAPRPLALHLAIQNLTFTSSLCGLQSLKDGSLVWKDSLAPRARSLRERLNDVDADQFAEALNAEIARRVQAFAEGVNRFADAVRPPSMPALPDIWSEGTTRVLRAEAAGTPVILIPSLVNRAHILDLDPDHSLLRFLAANGHDTYLVDWDAPGAEEKYFTIDHYVDRLERIRDQVIDTTGEMPVIVGYCMGGNLALALAHRDPKKIRAMALLATPWDFSAMPPHATAMLKAMLPGLQHLIAQVGNLPIDVIQAMFSSRDPGNIIRKFRRFAAMNIESPEARAFILLEDWLNDGVPLAANVAVECLEDWYVRNRPMAGTWQSGGSALDPRLLDIPALVVIPDHDTIVPPASAAPLAELLPNVTLAKADAGHIGMVAGSRARASLYAPLEAWIVAVQ